MSTFYFVSALAVAFTAPLLGCATSTSVALISLHHHWVLVFILL